MSVSVPSRPQGGHSCDHCDKQFKKLKTLQLHIREDHNEKTMLRGQIVESHAEVNLRGNQNNDNDDEDTETMGEGSPDDSPEVKLEASETVEITPLEGASTKVECSDSLDGVERKTNEENSEDKAVVIDDNSEDENDLDMSMDMKIPTLTKEAILELIQRSHYFKNKPSIIKEFEPSFKNFDIIDPTLPSGFLVWEQHRPSGKHVDREYLTPDGFFILRSKLAVSEYSKMVLSTEDVQPPQRSAPAKRRSDRLTRNDKMIIDSPSPKKPRVELQPKSKRGRGRPPKTTEFKEALKARLGSSRSLDVELLELSSSLPATTRISYSTAPTEASLRLNNRTSGITISQVKPQHPPPQASKKKKIKCCDILFVTMAGFQNHRAKKHHNKDSIVNKGVGEMKENIPARRELSERKNQQYSCKNCDEVFSSRLLLLEHFKAKHILPCAHCKQVLKSQDILDAHIEKMHKFKCSNCDEVFRVQSSLKKHIVEKHEFRCSLCQAVMKTKAELESHTKEKHEGCGLCEDEDDFYWADSEHHCHYTRTGTRPSTDRVIVQRLYRGYFFFSAED